MVEASGLADFYRTEKEGQERLENLAELVNAAEAFVTQEGFGKDAVALPVDEPVGSIAQGLPAAVARVDTLPDAETGEIVSPLVAFLTHAALEAYQAAVGEDPALADGHYNLARLYESLGQPQHAIRHLGQYRRLLNSETR